MSDKINFEIDSLFATSGVNLSKQFSKNPETGELIKTPFPKEWQLDSCRSEIGSIEDLHQVIIATAEAGGCFLKGLLDRPLEQESRAGHTNADDSTQWVVLDVDDMDIEPQELMNLLGLGDVDYIIQASSSEGIGQ